MRWLVLGCFFAVLSAVSSATVSDGKPYLFIMAKPSVYNIGEKKAIYCKGLNLPQNLEWYSPSGDLIGVRSSQNTRYYVEKPKNNNSLESSIMPLIFVSLMIEDSGNWTCKAGEELSESIEIFVGEKVQMDVKEEDVVGDQDKTAKLTCDANGTPEPVVQWYRDISVIEADQKKYFMRKKGSSHMLEIKNLNHLDSGTYMCRATQEKLSYFVDKIFHLYVKHPPVITNQYTEREVYAIMYEVKNITCNAIANPPPTFSWSKRNEDRFDQVITDEDTVYIAEDGSYSVLMLKVHNESDLGQYKCSVHNNRGRQHFIFDVTLGNKPNPPTSVSVYEAQPHNITFNVTCDNCTFERIEGIDPKPDNLPVLGYTFELVPCREGFATPNWLNATEYRLDIINATDTLFTVDSLINATSYHARVATRNAAGLSDWFPILPNPKTTDHASAITASLAVLITAVAAALSI